MDAFFVSVELLRRPDLVGQPVVVGGTGRRGVVAAASYEARRYGVFSASSTAAARRRCPHAVFLQGDYDRYVDASRDVMEILRRRTPLVEPLSLDEAFLDVTGSRRLLGDGPTIADAIRRDVKTELGLDCSVGVAPNKFLAKMASVEAKPTADPAGVRPGRGIVEIRPGDELAYLHPLPVQRLWGVGPATREKLSRLGVVHVGDLVVIDRSVLRARLGPASSAHLIALAEGRDDRAVVPARGAKSIGHEETFAIDLYEIDELHRELVRLAEGVAGRLRRHGTGARTLTLKVRFSDFTTVSRSITVAHPSHDRAHIVALVEPLLHQLDLSRGVRLLGVSGSKFAPVVEQLSLLAAGDLAAPPTSVTSTIDDIRRRFGAAAIGPASTVRDGRIRPVRRGEQQWGPNESPQPPAR